VPAPQREAPGTVFGMSAGSAPGQFLVGLAVLRLLSDVAEERPLLCLIDDWQWVDRASAQALAFVARRLDGEAVGRVSPCGRRVRSWPACPSWWSPAPARWGRT
jgi:hypothetical protein